MIDNVSGGLDKLHYGSQEKAEHAAADTTEARQMFIEWIKNTQGQNLSRRLIALSTTAVWLLDHIAIQICSIWAVWSSEPDKINKTIDALQDGASTMNPVIMIVFGFYFAGPYVGKITAAALTKIK